MRFAQARPLGRGHDTGSIRRVRSRNRVRLYLQHFDFKLVRLKTLHENHQIYYTRSLWDMPTEFSVFEYH